MDYPKHLFKSPGSFGSGDRSYNVAGASDEEQEIGLLDRGWHETKEAAFTAANLDHDGDGKAGGSIAAKGADVPGLRAEYQAAHPEGKKPFAGWDEETLREKIAALKGE